MSNPTSQHNPHAPQGGTATRLGPGGSSGPGRPCPSERPASVSGRQGGDVSAPELPIRLAGGELLIDPETAALLSDLLIIALDARSDLRVVRTARDAQRRSQLRALFSVLPASAPPSEVGRTEAVSGDAPASSLPAITTSVQEAAQVLGLTMRRVRQLLDAGALTGEQDAPGRPWRVHVDSLRTYQRTRIS